MASTAAPSAPLASPRPIHLAAASAATSVTRTSSKARFRSGTCLSMGGRYPCGRAQPVKSPAPLRSLVTTRVQLIELAVGELAEPETHGLDRLGGAQGELSTVRGELGQDDATVGVVGHPADQTVAFEPVDDAGDAGRMDHQAVAHLPHRQRTAPGEQQQHQNLVAGEGQAKRTEGAVDLGQHQLLGAHDGGGRGHGPAFLPPVVPMTAGLLDRIEGQGGVPASGHATILGGPIVGCPCIVRP